MILLATYTATGACIEYEIGVRSFSGPTRATRWDPGDGGEVELSPFVTVSVDGEDVGVTTLDVALLAYAAEKGWTLDKAIREVEDQALEAAIEEAADRWEDQRASYDEDRRWL